MIVAIQVFQMLFTVLWWPVTMQDDWAQWSANAKYLFNHGAVDTRYFLETNHSNYPLFLMSNAVLLGRINNGWSDFLCNAFPTLMLLDFCLIILGHLGRRYGRAFGISAVFITLTMPVFSRVGRDGTAEIPSAIMVGIASIYLIKALRWQNRSSAFLFGFFAGMIPAIKSEGFAVTFILLAIYLFFSWRDRRHTAACFLIAILPAIVCNLSWRYLMFAGECSATRFHLFTLAWLTDPAMLADLSGKLLRFISPSKDHLFLVGTALPVAAAYVALKNRQDRESLILLLIFFLISCAYALGCYSTNHGTEYYRLLWHTVFIIMLLAARQVSSAFKLISEPDDARQHQLTAKDRIV